MEISLSISPCPNDTFMFDAMLNRPSSECGIEFRTSYFDIEELNARVIEGIPQVSKISAAILPLIADRYRVLDAGAALGRGNGPLMVRRKGDTSPIRRVVVPGMHTTANLLVKRLFEDIKVREPMLFSSIAASVEQGEYDAGVLIHEGRFVYAERNLSLVADLGELWEQRTGLPLPLGLIVVRRDVEQTVADSIEKMLRDSISEAFRNPTLSRGYIKSHAQEIDDDVISKHIALFVNEFSLSLGDEGRAAIAALTGCEI